MKDITYSPRTGFSELHGQQRESTKRRSYCLLSVLRSLADESDSAQRPDPPKEFVDEFFLPVVRRMRRVWWRLEGTDETKRAGDERDPLLDSAINCLWGEMERLGKWAKVLAVAPKSPGVLGAYLHTVIIHCQLDYLRNLDIGLRLTGHINEIFKYPMRFDGIDVDDEGLIRPSGRGTYRRLEDAEFSICLREAELDLSRCVPRRTRKTQAVAGRRSIASAVVPPRGEIVSVISRYCLQRKVRVSKRQIRDLICALYKLDGEQRVNLFVQETNGDGVSGTERNVVIDADPTVDYVTGSHRLGTIEEFVSRGSIEKTVSEVIRVLQECRPKARRMFLEYVLWSGMGIDKVVLRRLWPELGPRDGKAMPASDTYNGKIADRYLGFPTSSVHNHGNVGKLDQVSRRLRLLCRELRSSGELNFESDFAAVIEQLRWRYREEKPPFVKWSPFGGSDQKVA